MVAFEEIPCLNKIENVTRIRYRCFFKVCSLFLFYPILNGCYLTILSLQALYQGNLPGHLSQSWWWTMLWLGEYDTIYNYLWMYILFKNTSIWHGLLNTEWRIVMNMLCVGIFNTVKNNRYKVDSWWRFPFPHHILTSSSRYSIFPPWGKMWKVLYFHSFQQQLYDFEW